MKNIFAVSVGVFIAILIGSLFMGISNREEDTTPVSSSNEIKAFQIAAFNDQKTADEEANKKKGIVIKDNNYYCVYIAILKDQTNINKMISYLNENKTYYYLKTIDLNSDLTSELIKYEELMKNTTSNVAFLKLNDQILKLIGENYEN